jgi:hypothetical protein
MGAYRVDQEWGFFESIVIIVLRFFWILFLEGL